MRKSLILVLLLSGCAIHPITGRNQIQALPAVQAAYADLTFTLSTEAWTIAAPLSCDPDCGGAQRAADLSRRVARLGGELEVLAHQMSPELKERIGSFRIEVSEVPGVATASSAGGRISIGAELAALEPTDAVLAFLIAREMGHVIARHAEENSGASMLFTVLGFLLPGFHALARFAATTVGSGVLRSSWAAEQQREGDEIAVALLARAGLAPPEVALALAHGLDHPRLAGNEWSARYLESVRHVGRIATAPPPAGGVYVASDELRVTTATAPPVTGK